jgi:hypothetical protein
MRWDGTLQQIRVRRELCGRETWENYAKLELVDIVNDRKQDVRGLGAGGLLHTGPVANSFEQRNLPIGSTKGQ